MYGSMNEYNPQSPHTTASREGCPSTANGHQKQVNRPSSLPVYTARDVLWLAAVAVDDTISVDDALLYIGRIRDSSWRQLVILTYLLDEKQAESKYTRGSIPEILELERKFGD